MKQTVAALATMAILAGTSHAAINGTKPAFMDRHQLAAMRASASSISADESDNPIFFTGKPYLASSDGYAFRYRSYSPGIARWTSEDPSGFPDGANGSYYAPKPTSELDPHGLKKVTVTGTPESNTSSGSNFNISVVTAPMQLGISVAAKFSVDWQIGSGLNGWVVQQVEFDFSNIFNDSDNSPYNYPNPPPSIYWEAWKVSDGVASGGDTFQVAFDPNTYGSATVTGKVDFYGDSVFTTTNHPGNWSVDAVPYANGLNATTSQPSWWTGSGFNHNMKVVWE